MWRKPLRLLLWTAVVCAALCGVGYAFCDPWTIPGDDDKLSASIEPTLSAGDLLLVARSQGSTDGALVRCADPDAPGRYVMGRVVGHSGDVIEFTSGALLVNTKPAPASIACDPATVHVKNPATQEDEELRCTLEDLGGGLHPMLHRIGKDEAHDTKVTVEPGKVYLVSDNRVMHLDSRDFMGVMPLTCQRVVYRLWGASGWLDAKKRLTILW